MVGLLFKWIRIIVHLFKISSDGIDSRTFKRISIASSKHNTAQTSPAIASTSTDGTNSGIRVSPFMNSARIFFRKPVLLGEHNDQGARSRNDQSDLELRNRRALFPWR
jgi:hypothetical protein